MRLALAFLAACLMALALFVLMFYLVAPPRSQAPDEPLSLAHFVRLDGESSPAASRSRQQAPQPPQPQSPQPPLPSAPAGPAPSASLPSLELPLPSLAGPVSLASAPAPSLAGLSAAADAPAAAPSSESSGAPGGADSEVVPLNEVRPEYPHYALQRGIQGHVKLAFTINRAGAVENLRVLEASPANVFEREARRAALRWRFAPRTENGQAVAREAVKTLYFRLQGGA